MKRDTIYQIRSQLNGGYMPDHFMLFSSYRDARREFAQMRKDARENGCDTLIDHGQHVSMLFIREEWQEHSRENDFYPYYHVLEPVSWRDIAHDIGVSTRQEVLEYEM